MSNSSGNNLFNNALTKSALKALTPEQLEEYNKIGEYMFKTNFTDENPDPEKEMKEAIVYITTMLKSGFHPGDLKPRELQIMYDIFGDVWYEKYGYSRDEVPPRVGIVPALGTAANPLPSDTK